MKKQPTSSGDAKPRKAEKSKKKPVRISPEEIAATERMAVLFKALADPTRLRIIHLLRLAALDDGPERVGSVDKATDVRRGNRERASDDAADATADDIGDEMTVGDICLHITGDREFTSTVFHHIKELKNARLITVRRDGKHKRCRLNRERFTELAEYLEPNRGGGRTP